MPVAAAIVRLNNPGGFMGEVTITRNFPIDIAQALQYIAHEEAGYDASFSYSGTVSGNTKTQYDAITWTDPYTKPTWAHLLEVHTDAVRWAYQQDMFTNWVATKAGAASASGSQATAISTLQSTVGGHTTSIGTLQTDLSAAQSAITALDGRIAALELL